MTDHPERDGHADDERPGDHAPDEQSAASPSTASDTPSGEADRRPSRLPRALVVALVLVAVGLAVFAFAERSRADDAEAVNDARDDVARLAAEFGEVYLSYDFENDQVALDRVAALSTESFASDYSETRAPGLEDLFSNLETSTDARTKEVFVGNVDDEAGSAFVVVDVDASSAASGNQTLSDLTFVIDVVHGDDGWLVDRVAPAPQPDVVGDGADGGRDDDADATTTTTGSTPTTAGPTSTGGS